MKEAERALTAIATFFENLNALMTGGAAAPAAAGKPATAGKATTTKAADKPAAASKGDEVDGDKVRAILAEVMTKKGDKGRETVLGLLSAVKAKRLADVKPEDYALLYSQAERALKDEPAAEEDPLM
jgi:hypothetical protein